MTKVTDTEGNVYDFEYAVSMMDEELREEVHADMAPCTDQEFFEEYVTRHNERFEGAPFFVYAR